MPIKADAHIENVYVSDVNVKGYVKCPYCQNENGHTITVPVEDMIKNGDYNNLPLNVYMGSRRCGECGVSYRILIDKNKIISKDHE